jgi:hypothetical protein
MPAPMPAAPGEPTPVPTSFPTQDSNSWAPIVYEVEGGGCASPPNQAEKLSAFNTIFLRRAFSPVF